MREILFRGKATHGLNAGDWIYGYYVKDFWWPTRGGHGILPIDEKRGGYCEVNPETVGQYTGLTDKNGKKIFEGDIFRIEDDMIAVIIFKDGCFRLQVYGVCGTFTESGYDEDGGGYGVIECEPIDWYYIHDMQVIGNIHDNPELLKGGAK